LPLFLVIAQVLLGIFSILKSNKIVPNKWGSFEWLAQLHQLTGMLLLLSLVLLQYVVKREKI
jgi:cytochrome c oxidase assembly protein subunit 15